MSETIEVQLEELAGSDLAYWAGRKTFEIKDARFLLNDFKPSECPPKKRFPRRIVDTENRLRTWLNENGHGGILGTPSSGMFRRDVPYIPGTPDKPIPIDVLKVAAEAMGLRPKFLYPIEAEEPQAYSGWPWGSHETQLLRFLAEAAQRFWVNYDPADPSTAPTNEQVSEWLEEKGVSKQKAEVMATILRADGLPDGRRKR
jgi:hypothetical protein